MDSDFGHWLAGFVDGEGCFQILRNGRGARYCSFRITLRADDEQILREIHAQTGLGKVWVQTAPSQKKPVAIWQVASKRDCAQLVGLFKLFPLRAKKRRDFEIWSEAVDLWQDMIYASPTSRVKNDWTEFDRLTVALRSGREFSLAGD